MRAAPSLAYSSLASSAVAAPAAAAALGAGRLLHSAAALRSSSSAAAAVAAAPAAESAAPSVNYIVAPAFGAENTTPYKFMYLKGVKTDGRTKRFYDSVRLEEVDTPRGREVAVLLDGRYVVTHHDQLLSCPNAGVALGVAFEFDAQGDFIRPVSMPMTEMVVTALDQALVDRERFIGHFRSAMHTDSVLLRVSAPSGLVTQQRRQWDPLLVWFRHRYDCALQTTLEIESPVQSAETIAAQQRLLHCLNGWQLAALDQLCTVTKSFVISWAVLAERLTVAQAFEAARLEENWQMRAYGKVEGIYGHGIDMEFVRMNVAAAKTLFNLLQDGQNKPEELETNKPQAKQ